MSGIYTHTHTHRHTGCNTCSIRLLLGRGNVKRHVCLPVCCPMSCCLFSHASLHATIVCVASAAAKKKHTQTKCKMPKSKNNVKSPDHAHVFHCCCGLHSSSSSSSYSSFSYSEGLMPSWCTAVFKTVCQSFFHIIDCLLDYKPRGWASTFPSRILFLFSLSPSLLRGTCCMNGRAADTPCMSACRT